MVEVRALIAAAGRGIRAGLPYPKTLYVVQGKPILARIVDLVGAYTSGVTVIVSPQGKELVSAALKAEGYSVELLVQAKAKGMGDAVLCFEASTTFSKTEHVLLVWGDIPFIQKRTVEQLVTEHLAHNSDFTFATRRVDTAYTVVSRDSQGRVTRVVETRELGIDKPQAGERDIGLFIFRKSLVLEMLKEDLPGKWGQKTGEHGFLYLIGNLAARGFNVLALPIATELDLVSLNSLNDLDDNA